jgi:hypothetical protein
MLCKDCAGTASTDLCDLGEWRDDRQLGADLEQDGVVGLPNLLSSEQLKAMQQAFNVRLKWLRWNNLDGYEKTEPNRHMVEDVLTLEQGFLDAALHPASRRSCADT